MGKAARDFSNTVSANDVPDRFIDESDATPEEVQAIELCVCKDENLVHFYSTPRHTEFSVKIWKERIREESQGLNRWALVIDLTRANKPTPEGRELLKEAFQSLSPSFISVFTGKNRFINIVAKYVLGAALRGIDFNISKTRSEAVELAKNAIK